MKYFLRISVFSQLALLFFVTSCSGQVKKGLPEGSGAAEKTTKHGDAKLVKTQGTDQYATTNSGLRDKAGDLWFCTAGEGVYRYDGTSFTHYTEKDGLPGNAVFLVLEDKEGNMWFGSREGLCRYDGKIFTRFAIPTSHWNSIQLYNLPDDNPSSKNELWSMMQDRSGKMWLGTTHGIYCFNPSSGVHSTGITFTRFLDNDSIVNKDSVQLKWTQCMFEDRNGTMWFGSWVLGNEGICRYDGKTLTQFKPYGEGWIRTILEDKNGDLLFVTRHNGVCRFDGKTFVNFTQSGGIDNTSITTAFEDKAGNLWFGTELGSGGLNEDGGLWRYDGKSFIRYTRKDGLCHNGVFSIVEDKDGNIWLGTRNIGLCRFDGTTFTSFSE